MADPTITALAADTWVKVATDVTTGQVHINERNSLEQFIHTYRDFGGAAPISSVAGQAEGVAFGGFTEQIVSAIGIDVYIMSKGTAGKVRVDLV